MTTIVALLAHVDKSCTVPIYFLQVSCFFFVFLIRKLAKDFHVQWSEYWQFLDAFADFSTQVGLAKLEEYLTKQKAHMAILAACRARSSSSDENDDDSDDSSETDSQAEDYFSCDEESPKLGNNFYHNWSQNRRTETTHNDDDDENEVFEDSFDSFHDTQSYVFGQRLQLKPSHHQTGSAVRCDPTDSNTQQPVDLSVTPHTKSGGGRRGLWMYRDDCCPNNNAHAADTSLSSDTTNSFDTSNPVSLATEQASIEVHAGSLSTPTSREKSLEKSFNTVMTELSEDLESKLLIFSPDGQVVAERKSRLLPDLGLCLGHTLCPNSVSSGGKGRCLMEVLVKGKKDGSQNSLLADVLIRVPSVNTDWDSDDQGGEEVGSKERVVLDVTLVTKNSAVLRHVQRLRQAVRLSVGLLEKDGEDLLDSRGLACATVARLKKSSSKQQPEIFIYG
jgi:hypothetical protein